MKHARFIRIITLCLLLLLLAACGDKEPVPAQPGISPTLNTELTIEAGTITQLDPAALLPTAAEALPELSLPLTAEQLSTPGTYNVQAVYSGYIYDIEITVVDTTPPVPVLQNLITADVIPTASDFVVSIEDIDSNVTVEFESEPIVTENGEQTLTLIFTDSSGNTSTGQAILSLYLDLEAPQIHGVPESFLVDQGGTISYRTGVTVTDNRDQNPVLTIDSSGVDLSSAGDYMVIFQATDAAGNTSEVSAPVIVREMGETTAPLEDVLAMVDKLAHEITTEDMNDYEKLSAIHQWFRKNCRYRDTAESYDIYQAAYVMMTNLRGDCFDHFALAKLLMEALEIPNIDVRKVKNHEADSDHFWSLVSFDGGETWYHFDTTPRVNKENEDLYHVFLYTDAQLDALSKASDNCFNRDKSLYPATPETKAP